MLRAAHRPLGSMHSCAARCRCASPAVAAGRRRRARAEAAGRDGGCTAAAAAGRIVTTPESASAWRKPEAGRLKLNFDGSSEHASRCASIGGVYRDHEGGFVQGNLVAHGFAKLGHGAASPTVWRDTPPDEVLMYLQRDAEAEG